MSTTPEKFGQPPEAEALIKKRMMSLRLVWIVLFLFLLYKVSCVPADIQTSLQFLSPNRAFVDQRALTGIGLFLLFLSWMVPRFLLKKAEKKKTSLFLAATQGFLSRLGFLLFVGLIGTVMTEAMKDFRQGLPMVLAAVIGFLLNFPMARKFNREASDLFRAQNNSDS